jgi:ribosomal protein S18 acetylase RimI-like enzyme
MESCRAIAHWTLFGGLLILKVTCGPKLRLGLDDELKTFPSTKTWQGVVEARDDGALVGVALVSISRDSNVPYGVIEDIVVEQQRRGKGHGETILRWLLEHFDRAGITRVFLESGLSNGRAHHLFERLGFKTVSVVMMREL